MDNPVQAPPPGLPVRAADFDEETYLRYNPDVRAAVQAGAFRSGRDHYEHYGKGEGRPCHHVAHTGHGQVVITSDILAASPAAPAAACGVETICVSDSGGIFIAGWVADAHDPLDSVDVYFGGWSVSYAAAALARTGAHDGSGLHAGFWGFIFADRHLPAGQCSIILKFASGAEIVFASHAGSFKDAALRGIVLQHLGTARIAGHPDRNGTCLPSIIGDQLMMFATVPARSALTGFHVASFGNRASCKTSMVCVNAAAGTMSLQTALFASLAGVNDIEFIHVSTMPADAEALLREAKLCARIYGAAQTVILLPGEAGFAAAQNLAATQASSDRLLFISPGMLPARSDWLARHAALIGMLPAAQTTLFGAPFYHEDGVLAAAGWYFEHAATTGSTAAGAPPAADLRLRPYLTVPPHPAPVLDRFLSIARPHFESLGGFAEAYFTAADAYADLCLNSIAHGSAPWLHDLPLWDLAAIPDDPGAAIFNRWMLRHQRGGAIASLTGQQPLHALFA